MTDAQDLDWLKSQAAYRVVLIEAAVQIGGVESVVYMATKPFTTGAADTPANTSYLPIATVGTLFTEMLSLEGDGALSAGRLEVDNHGGARDEWLGSTVVLTNRTLKARLGDIRWAQSDFPVNSRIFDGITADVSPQGRDKIGLKLRDKLQRLNTPISEAKLGGTGENQDALLPITLGQVFNVTPLLIEPTTLKYRVHTGPIDSVIEVRDNGAPVAFTADLAAGTITLDNAPAGAVTASVRGDKAPTYGETAAQLVKRLVTGFGKVSDRFTDDDIDLANFAAFDAAHPQGMGLYATDRLNVLTACQMLVGSLGAQLVMSRIGKLRIIKLALPGAGTPFAIRPEHMVDGTLQPIGRTAAVGAVKLGFCKNWTVQEAGTLAGLPDRHKDLFSKEGLTATKTDAATISKFKLNAEPVQQDTLLLTRAEAEAEAQRRLDLWKVSRTTYEFVGLPELLQLELGQAITVYSPRFGMSAGVAGIVISLAPDWNTGRVKVGFLV
jgi:hypothetical protein